VYANNTAGWGEDGRIAWMLKMAGLPNAKILDGGFTYWSANNYPTTTSRTPAPQVTSFVVSSFDSSYTITKVGVSTGIASLKIVDARDTAEFNGAQLYGEKRGGHLPGAVSLPFKQVFESNGLIRSQSDLEALFSASGISASDQIVTYCTKGIRSAHLALILRMAGYTNTRNYDGSFYEWAGDSTLQVVK
jgi:thiosulfate/3-mercaptopyruvate sulfurtransferase